MRTERRAPYVARIHAIARAEAQIRDGFPRLQMALLVALTGGFGLLASFSMLHLGIDLGDAAATPVKAAREALSSVGDADELAVPIVVIVFAAVLAVGLAMASFYVIYIAPALFAEVVVDGALSYALFRHLRSEDRPFWLATAMRHTWMPFALTAVFLAAVGFAMSVYAPGAKSIGQVVRHASSQGLR